MARKNPFEIAQKALGIFFACFLVGMILAFIGAFAYSWGVYGGAGWWGLTAFIIIPVVLIVICLAFGLLHLGVVYLLDKWVDAKYSWDQKHTTKENA